MDLKGIFTPNTIAMPQWKNKDGENEFEKLLNRLADMGKKLTVLKKKADIPVQMPTKEETVSVEHYDATPRPLGEIFHNRGQMSEQAITKAREIIGKQILKLNLPASDVYYMKSDISRFAGDGTPATGRISFQIPFMTPQGDNRTIYADVDIVLSSLIPPRQFYDGMNQRYAFTEDGLKELLHGRDFELMQNIKVNPETTYFESPGHLAGRGGMMVTKYAKVKTAIDEEQGITKAPPGTEIGEAIGMIEKTTGDITALQKEIVIEQKKLDAIVKGLPKAGEVAQLQKNLKETILAQKDALSKTETLLGQIKDGIVENKGRIYKLQSKEEKGKTPVYTGVVGKLIAMYPNIKGIIDNLWADVRSITAVKTLLRESPTEESKEWEIRREAPKQPDVPLYKPPEKEGVVQEKMQKKASLIDNLENLVKALMDMDALLNEAGV